MKQPKKIFSLYVLTLLIITFTSCHKNRECNNCSNRAPVAKAGDDITVVVPKDSVVLDGRYSLDFDGHITKFQWTKISGPSSLNINEPNKAMTVVKNLVVGDYQFELKVTDEMGLSTSDTILVSVVFFLGTNIAPVANAGLDQTINLPANSATLNGSQSHDGNGNLTSYQWTKISGPASVNTTDPGAVQVQITNLIEGIYEFELKVTDAVGLWDTDTVIINVYAPCEIRPVINAQLIPVGDLSIGRTRLFAATAGSKILFAGGDVITNGNMVSQSTRVDIYDFVSNTWSTAELSDSNKIGMGVTSVGSKIFFAGGSDFMGDWITSSIDIYDAANNTWTIDYLSQARSGIAAATIGNKVFFAGGYTYDQTSFFYSNRVDVYDNSTGSWSVASLSNGKLNPVATVAGNKVFFAGGNIRAGNLMEVSKVIDVYDVPTNSWSIQNLQEPRSGMASVAFGNKIYWGSGYNSFGSNSYSMSNTVETFDVQTGAVSVQCMSPRAGSTAVVKNDKIIFFTGHSNESTSGTRFEIFNTTTNTWSTGVIDQRIVDAAIISVNNTIYIAGGMDPSNASTTYGKVWKLVF